MLGPHLHPSVPLESPGSPVEGRGCGGLTAHPADRASPPLMLAPWLLPSPEVPPPTCLLSAWPTQTPLRSYFPPLFKVHPLPAPKCASGSPRLWFPVILLILLFLLGGFSAV